MLGMTGRRDFRPDGGAEGHITTSMTGTLFHQPAWGARIAVFLAVAVTALPAWCEHPCAPCHPKEVAGYAATQMAHSLGPATLQPSGKFTHAASKTQFTIESIDARMIQRLERNGVSGEHQPLYAVGSGAHAVGYLIQRGDHLFQSPLTYYTGRGWDMSPGYENDPAPDFYRPVTPDCLVCHAGRARPLAGTLNGYQMPPFEAEAITCERCHGPVEAHLRDPSPGSIINPAKLPRRARDSICEQCHLSGDARIPNPGKQLSDFRPGQELEEVYSVYVFEASLDPSRPNALKVISQAQQLALSTCARRSQGKLWCGTCHDPHGQPADPKTDFRSRCLSCHGAALVKMHPQPNNDCIGCHMPRRPVSDGGHTVFTDHRIARRPPTETGATAADVPSPLVAWHDPPAAFAQRNLGLAGVEVGERLKSTTLISPAVQLLMSCWPGFPQDPPLLTAIGQVLLGVGDNENAAAVFERAIQAEPNVAAHYLHAALAWRQAKDQKKAIAYLEQAVQRDPLLEEPYRRLAEIYSEAHNTAMVRQTYERYLAAFPKSIEAQTEVRSASVLAQDR
jgi:Cytochrome c554 and c-prime/Tetratricopeptide repeat